ncbi:TIGR00266 family protein [Staphylothermus hellenicus]|uniref:TIGR00266 family protein n=1 Tax=Staphylothermus hellenicus (strain DSM 12710 / JCM 10830 / BK20S6-10-b1 / P8) TaxID=591019 RepID=D7DBH8_STAHD|nr:TIGR00266 family protein [Staphylothermus hellenicus]ADI31525.1 protein of unknown function DUF124 [Staphylothermus hellenicus DSM 12710]
MKWEIVTRPSYSLLQVVLEPNENVTAEPGAMMYMAGDINVKTHTGGLGKAIARKLLGGESIFMNTFIAGPRGGEVWFAPSLPGDIKYIALNGSRNLIIQDTSYLAHHGDIKLSVAWRGLRGLLAEGEMFWLRASGVGGVWINSYGGIIEKELGVGEKIIIDNFHFVAMDDGMKWNIRRFGGLKSFLFGGEGLVIEVEGPGRIYVQTRSLPPFMQLIAKYIGRRK